MRFRSCIEAVCKFGATAHNMLPQTRRLLCSTNPDTGTRPECTPPPAPTTIWRPLTPPSRWAGRVRGPRPTHTSTLARHVQLVALGRDRGTQHVKEPTPRRDLARSTGMQGCNLGRSIGNWRQGCDLDRSIRRSGAASTIFNLPSQILIILRKPGARTFATPNRMVHIAQLNTLGAAQHGNLRLGPQVSSYPDLYPEHLSFFDRLCLLYIC
jgi:hypothetical protein